MVFTTQIKKGMYINYREEPHLIVMAQFSRQGRVAAFTRTKLKNLFNGKVIAVTFDSGQKVEEVDVNTKTMQYVYNDESNVYVMDKESFEQFEIDRENVGDVLKFLKEGDDCVVKFYEEKPIMLEPKSKVKFKVVDTIIAVKGNTATGATKKATIETGAVIDVPLFISEGESIVVNTESGSYVSKA